MIVVLNCSTSWCRNKVFEPDTIPSTGGLEQSDTMVSIPISFIKIANSKMTELKYEKEINSNLHQIIYNDSLIIQGINYELDNCIKTRELEVKKIMKQRNILFCTTIGAALLSLLLLIK